MTSKTSNGKTQRELDRGLKDLLADQSLFQSGFNQLPEHVKAARIGAAILELIDIVDAKYQPVIFQSVNAYRAVAEEESPEAIGKRLCELERERNTRKEETRSKRWYYLYLR